MTIPLKEQHRLAALGWLATVAMSLAFVPTLKEKNYFLLGAGLAAAVVVLGMLLRQLRLPPLVVLPLQLILLLELLVLRFGHHTKWGLLPTGASFQAIGDHISAGMDVAQQFAAPAPQSAGLTLLVACFVAIVAALVDFCVAGIARVPICGLPLLALYTVPVAILPDGVHAVYFVPGAVVFIALLMVSERERLAHWGRRVTRGTSPDHVSPVDTSGLAATGRRISVLAVATAVVVPALLPSFSVDLFGTGRGGGNGPGNGLSLRNPMVSLAHSLHRKDPVDVLQVESSGTPRYLRLAVLDQPDPNAWVRGKVQQPRHLPIGNLFPRPGGLSSKVATTPQTMSLRLERGFPGDSHWLPIPFGTSYLRWGSHGAFGQPTSTPPRNSWSYLPRNQSILATRKKAIQDVDSYSVSYLQIKPTRAQLRGAGPAPAKIADHYAVVPDKVPHEIGKAARSITAGAESDYRRALMMQSYFRDSDEFTYDLDASYGYGYKAMVKFLKDRRGYCQQFAATMAMMARTLGIPSRVVVGFLRPTKKHGDVYTFTSHSAHSWPELYFAGVGWVRFEPTPGNGAHVPGYAPILATPPTTTPTGPSTSNPAGAGRLPGERAQDQQPGATTPAATPGKGSSGSGAVVLLVVICLLVLLLLPAMLRRAVRRSRLARPGGDVTSAELAWVELRDSLRDFRLSWTGSMSPRARERVVAPYLEGDEQGRAALQRLTHTVERARYARAPLTDATPGSDVKEVMAVVSRGMGWPQRLMAAVIPTSLMSSIRTGMTRVRRRLRPSAGGE
ncbi:MAG: transglutaminaseTgpA domain-containing protein [Nocardioidaceae bacterium]